MLIFIQELLIVLILSILKMIQALVNIIHYLFGISDINHNGNSINILEHLIDNVAINYYLFAIALVALLIGGFFAIVAIVKVIINNKQNIINIIGKYVTAIITLFITLFIIILLVKISNAFFSLIMKIFTNGYNIDISNTILDLSVLNWNHHYNINDINLMDIKFKDIYGNYLYESYQLFPVRWLNDGYINLNTFMYLPSLITSIIVLVAMLYCCFQLVKRIYEIVLLYIMMPMSIFTISMDDGIRFKVWLELFLNKLFLSFFIFISLNIYTLLFSVIKSFKLYNINTYENKLFFLLFIAGGSLMMITSQKIFSSFFNGEARIKYQSINKFKRNYV